MAVNNNCAQQSTMIMAEDNNSVQWEMIAYGGALC